MPGRTIPIALAAMLPVGTFYGGVQVQKYRYPVPTASKEAFEEYRKQVIWETFDRQGARDKIIMDEMDRRGMMTLGAGLEKISQDQKKRDGR